MKPTITQLNRLTQEQRNQLQHDYKYRNCKHNYSTWGICDICKKIIDPDSVKEFERLHPHLPAKVGL